MSKARSLKKSKSMDPSKIADPSTLGSDALKIDTGLTAIDRAIQASHLATTAPSKIQEMVDAAKNIPASVDAMTALARDLPNQLAKVDFSELVAAPSISFPKTIAPPRISAPVFYGGQDAPLNASARDGLSTISSSADLGELVRRAREERKLSQQSFADLAGVGRRFVSELENGKATLEFDKVIKVARAAGISFFAKPR